MVVVRGVGVVVQARRGGTREQPSDPGDKGPSGGVGGAGREAKVRGIQVGQLPTGARKCRGHVPLLPTRGGRRGSSEGQGARGCCKFCARPELPLGTRTRGARPLLRQGRRAGRRERGWGAAEGAAGRRGGTRCREQPPAELRGGPREAALPSDRLQLPRGRGTWSKTHVRGRRERTCARRGWRGHRKHRHGRPGVGTGASGHARGARYTGSAGRGAPQYGN